MKNETAAQPGRQGGDGYDEHPEYWGISNTKSSPEFGFSLQCLAEMPPPKPRIEIVEGLLAEGEILLLTGHAKSGKSLLAARLAASITTGEDFCGRAVKCGRVVYLALERHALQRRRLEATGADPRATIGTPLRVRIDLSDKRQMQHLASALEAIDPALVIIDTAAMAMPDLDENSSRDAGLAMAGLSILQDKLPAAALVLVHHLPKSGGGPRGSGAILAAADVELRVDRSKEVDAVRFAIVADANDIEEGQRLTFTIDHRDGEAVAVACEMPSDRAAGGVSRIQSDRHAMQAEEADRRAEGLLTVLPNTRFNKSDAIEAAVTAGMFGADVKETSRPKIIARMLDRLIEQGALIKDGLRYEKVVSR